MDRGEVLDDIDMTTSELLEEIWNRKKLLW